MERFLSNRIVKNIEDNNTCRMDFSGGMLTNGNESVTMPILRDGGLRPQSVVEPCRNSIPLPLTVLSKP